MAVQEFKAESKKLLDLMINSIYTHKEIFLRELISNASDALDKLYFQSLTDTSIPLKKEDYAIRLTLDRENRTIIVSDNGIGMDEKTLQENLGTIAKSGSQDFKRENASEDVDIIGQFGVGFYSAFMVASHVTVISRPYGSEQAWKWESSGADGYTITPCQKESFGTDVILVVKPDTEEEHYDEFLDEYRLVGIVKKYSDYIRYPITMLREHSRKKEGTEDEYETYTELETLNSMVPLWKRDKKDVKPEEYNAFYKDKFFDFTDPARVIVSRTEGTATYNALLFIPGRAPFNYYTRDYEKGLQLYASGVLIMDKCADLLPDYFSFVKGLVDSQDLSLNISREMLQHDSQLRLIRTTLEKKIKNELTAMLRTDREKYDEFFKNFGLQLKVGCYEGYGANKEMLKDLLLFHSAKENKLITLEEYVAAMPKAPETEEKPEGEAAGTEQPKTEGQKYIYYAAGDSVERLSKLPAAERVLEKGYDILYLTADVDEFVLQVLREYSGKEFRNISSGEDLGLETEAEKEQARAENEQNKDLFAAMKEALGDKVTEVRLSTRLKSHPVCITSEGALSVEMEKVLNSMPNAEKVESKKILELNGSHPVFAALQKLQADGNTDKLAAYADLLYNQALLIEGLPIEDPVAYAQAVCDLMAQS
ncbi:molecular chaperone HtpG [Anaerofilum sp. An201]|nr:molecular chaperone HtpG [Anaerofilum sp. An201]OUP00008.1 molecular chaperone HtpG [Anaerofilum sp. An201]